MKKFDKKMSGLDQKLVIAKKRFRTRLLFGCVAGVLLLATLPLIYFTNSVSLQITPRSAAENFSATVTSGNGAVIFDSVYAFGARATARIDSPGFISRTVEVDFSKDAKHLTVEMREAPARVVITTEPALPQTSWQVDGVYAATAAQFDREFLPGAVSIEIDHEFYRPQTLLLEVQRGKQLTRHINLMPVIGTINLNSNPAGALVVVDGDEKGVTPINIANLRGGVHRVRVVLDAYQAIDEEIAITNTLTNMRRDYRLKLKQTTVRIKAFPAGGVLRVNEVVANVTPSLSLAAGRKHILRYEKPGYLRQSREVLLKANEQAEISFHLVKEIGEVVIRSTPSANVFINGAPMDATPQTLSLQALPQKIKLVRDGYRGVEFTVTPSASAPILIDKELKTEFAARLEEAGAVMTAAAGVTLKFFDPRGRANFTMGAPKNEKARRANEFQRRVNLTKPFYVGTTEITEAQFAQYKPDKSVQASGKKHPVRDVSWVEAAGFCNWMSAQDGLQPAYKLVDGQLHSFDPTADGYRLLSEAEWEWLARVAGRTTVSRFVWGDDATIPANSGNFADESAKGSVSKYIPRYNDGFVGVAPVASFVADATGLYDMAGNVSEWVHDVYDLRPPEPGQVETNPFGVSHEVGDERVVKGASFRSASITGLRSSFREGLLRRRDDVGFRVARYLYGKE